ncbi:polygalacturonase-like [Dorcoceras hygrometricum]|uniref:Polygalacturonase-like n=1 Tax=Dorcoceras hygrometricum TaxID=472368 RepID=A0A2Z7CDB0_9LAMI|nr:polygalacturonase-like [Dorcoceras hygrometricum]
MTISRYNKPSTDFRSLDWSLIHTKRYRIEVPVHKSKRCRIALSAVTKFHHRCREDVGQHKAARGTRPHTAAPSAAHVAPSHRANSGLDVAQPVRNPSHIQRASSTQRSAADRATIAREISINRRLAPTSFTRKPALQTVGGGRLRLIKSTIGSKVPSSACTRRPDEISTDGNSSSRWPEQVRRGKAAAARGKHGGGVRLGEEGGGREYFVILNGSGIQLAVGPQPLWLRNHNFGLAHRIMVKRLATSPHDLLGITDSACKNQLVVVSVQYGPFNPYIPIRSTTIGKSRVAIDPIAMHTSWRSNSDIASVTSTFVILNGSGIQLAVGPQPLWLRNHNFELAHRIMVKRLATSPHDPLGITDSACKNQLVVVSVQYGPFNPYIPIRSTTIGKSRVAIDPIAMHTSWRSNSDIVSVTRIRALALIPLLATMADPDPISRGRSGSLMNLARTESPQHDDRNKSDHGGGGAAVEAAAVRFWEERGAATSLEARVVSCDDVLLSLDQV